MNVTVDIPPDIIWLLRASAILFIIRTLAELYDIWQDNQREDLLTKIFQRLSRKEG